MSYERAMYERLICDGCGVAVLETEDVPLLSHAPDWGWSVGDKHLCHMCQPDSPFEAIQRVREDGTTPSTQLFRALDGYAESPPEVMQRLERAEAAIARVRQVLDEEQRGYNPPLGLISRIKTALDGPCPTCRGPIRETVGLVCQTCGTDYGRLDGTA